MQNILNTFQLIKFYDIFFNNMTQQYVFEVPIPPHSKPSSNYISTTKYNLFTFLPFSLILQFRRYANIYFLISAIMQSIPLISPLNPASAVAPLIFVLALSMCRQGFEDYKRWKSDKASNSSKTYLYKEGQFSEVEWKDIKVGEFIKVLKDEQFPADITPLFCSSATGISYVETSSLDGEKNLKPKISIMQSQIEYNKSQQIPKFGDANIKVICDSPNSNANKFDGKMKYLCGEIEFETQLNHKNLMLRGCKLRNTNWVIGLSVYIGLNTKIMKNGCENFSKTSNIQRKVNIIILVVLAFEIMCSLASAIYCLIQCNNNVAFHDFITDPPMTCTQTGGIAFGSYFILYSTFIPISLIVSLQFVKLFQGYAMSIDKEMYCKANQRSLECHTVSINEELGQIQYILTDKTGTLTCNKMQFRNVVVGNQVYGEDTLMNEINVNFNYQALLKRSSYSENSMQKMKSFDSRSINYELDKQQESQLGHRLDIEMMFFIITTCHQCLKDGQGYQGPSPDEVSLLEAAKKVGFQFLATQNKITTVLYKGVTHKFKILNFFQFDSDRKRMSIVLQYNGVIKVFSKGADSAIKSILLPNQRNIRYITDQTDTMSKIGLRCLWFAHKCIPPQEDYSILKCQEVEKDLNLIGATAIEDKLQDYVAETIYSLREGGIKFAMLTGDKLETADNIAKSCRLIDQGFLIRSDADLRERHSFLKENPSRKNDSCPVIDVSMINLSSHQLQISELMEMSKSAVFCRVTPSQKAQIVRIVKKLGKLTLAIGDGANDVNMILQADVGVGIFGNEGTRAAQVSNYAIGEFCLLWKLLLYYGRLNYMRITEMILYFFYKNMVFTIVQFAYAFYNLGSGQSFWLSWPITFYNMIFTLLPVVLRAVFEVDIDITSTKSTFRKLSEGSHSNQVLYSYYPKMYQVSQKNKLFTNLIFFEWFFLGVCQGVIILVITVYSIAGDDDTSGYNSLSTGFYFAEISAYTSVILLVTIKLALNVKNWNLLLVLSFLIPSIGAYILYCYASDAIGISITQNYTTDLLYMPTFYATQILCIFGLFSFDCFLFALQATKVNFENYLKYRSLKGKRLSETNLKQFWLQMQTEDRRPSN